MFDAGWYAARANLPPYGRMGSDRRTSILWPGLAMVGAAYGAAFAYAFPALLLELTLPLVLLTLAVIWLLPETRRVPIRTLTVLFFGFFLGAVLWPDYLALSLPGLPWITLRRVISVPLFLVLLICLSASRQVRSELKEVLNTSPLLSRLLIAFVGLQLISIALSHNPAFSADRFIVAQLSWTLPFFVGCYLFRDPRNIARWAAMLCLASGILTLIGLIEWRQGQVPWAGRIPWFLVVEDEVVQRILSGASRAATGIYRVQSSFTTSLGYAEFMALTVPFLIHFACGSYRIWIRVASLAALPLTFFMIMLTDSRLGMVGFFLSFLFYLLIWAARRWIHDRNSLIGPAIVLAYPAVFGLFIVATRTIGRLRTMVWGGGQHSFSTESRIEQYNRGLEILAGNPFGHGAGMGAETLGFTNLAGVLTIDTYYLAIALEYGVLGFLVFYGLIIAAIARAGGLILRARPSDTSLLYMIPVAVALGNFLVIKSVFSQDSNHPLLFMMIAMIMACAWRRGAEPRASSSRSDS